MAPAEACRLIQTHPQGPANRGRRSAQSAGQANPPQGRERALPECLEITAWTADGEIMGLRHRSLAVEGVQFHPESIASEHGHELLKNFLNGGRA